MITNYFKRIHEKIYFKRTVHLLNVTVLITTFFIFFSILSNSRRLLRLAYVPMTSTTGKLFNIQTNQKHIRFLLLLFWKRDFKKINSVTSLHMKIKRQITYFEQSFPVFCAGWLLKFPCILEIGNMERTFHVKDHV